MSKDTPPLGSAGIERAAVWAVTGAGLTFAGIAGAERIGIDPLSFFLLAVVTAGVGAIAAARSGTGLVGCVLLVAGPVTAGMLLEAESLIFVVPTLEGLTVALVVSGLGGSLCYLLGRGLMWLQDRHGGSNLS